MIDSIDLLILALGNTLLGDDGLGVRAVERLQNRYVFDDGVELMDGGTLGLSLLHHIGRTKALILVDAVLDGEHAGAPVRIDGEEVHGAVRDRLSPHQIGVSDVLEAARMLGCLPEHVVLLGVVPASLELGVSLSSPVAAALEGLVDRIAEEARDLGHPPAPRLEDGGWSAVS